MNPILSRLLPGAEQICTDRHWAVLLPDGVVIGVFAAAPDIVRLLDDDTHHFTEPEARAWLEARRDAWVQALGGPPGPPGGMPEDVARLVAIRSVLRDR